MAITILDDHQDAVRKLACARRLNPYPAKVHTHSVRGVGRLVVRLREQRVACRSTSATSSRARGSSPGSRRQPCRPTSGWAPSCTGTRWASGVTGGSGRIVAGYGRAFGMSVRVWGSADSMRRAQRDGHDRAASRDALLAQTDFLSLHLRRTQATRRMVGLEGLTRMTPTATLVNTSRAELLRPQALVAALQRGRPGLAAVDLFEQEPILRGHALLRPDNCICTLHIGHVEQQSHELQFSTAFDNIVNFLNGRPSHVVNPQAWVPAAWTARGTLRKYDAYAL